MYTKENIYDLLKQKEINYNVIEHNAVFTMEEMENCGITKKGTICKNLFLRDAKGKKHFLVSVMGDKPVNLKALGDALQTKLSFASLERLQKYLGVIQGAVSPLAILNDESKTVVFVADKDLCDKTDLGVHPNDNTATVFITYDALSALIKENGNDIICVDI